MTDEQRRADLIGRWHAEGICTEGAPAHDCPCDRPKGGGLEPEIRKVWTQARDACDPACPGWALFNEGTADEGIQRCDACARFVDDDAAQAHVIATARAADLLLLTLADLAEGHEGARVEVMPNGSVCFRAEDRERFGDADGGGLLASQATPVPGGGFAAAVAELRKEVADL